MQEIHAAGAQRRLQPSEALDRTARPACGEPAAAATAPELGDLLRRPRVYLRRAGALRPDFGRRWILAAVAEQVEISAEI